MSGNRTIGFGICGLGFMGRYYFSHVRGHPRARIAAVCDADAARRSGTWKDKVGNIRARGQEIVDMSGVAQYAAVDELLADPAVDVVGVTLPTAEHARVTIAALQAGKHVLCEKPMSLSVEDCDEMIRAARRSGRTLMIAQCIRFWPQYETIQRLIAEGRIGAVRFAFLRRIASPPQYSSGGWLMDGSRSGGAIFDLHVHDVDFAHVLMGVPDTVYARGTRGPSGEIDHVLATYGYADGRYALLEGGWVFHPPWPFDMSITVHGERGTLFWSMPRGPEVLLYAGAAEPETFPHDDQTGWMRELDYFIDCVLSGTPVQRCTPDSSRTSIALTLLERQSIDSGRLITTPADLRPGAH